MVNDPGNELDGESLEDQVEAMETWFRENFEDPAQSTPYESAEGGYQWIWGGPYDAREQLESQFGGVYSDEAINELADKLNGECWEWAPTTRPGDYDEEWFDAVAHNVFSRSTLDQDLAGVEALLSLAVPGALGEMLNRLLFANVITALETYLSDTFINRVLSDDERLQAYIDEEPNFRDRKVSYRNLLREASKVKEEARAEMLGTVWHKLHCVKPLYKKVLGVDLGDIGPLMKDVLTRHDIVHRNGRTKDGGVVDVRTDHVVELLARVRSLATTVDQQLNPMPF